VRSRIEHPSLVMGMLRGLRLESDYVWAACKFWECGKFEWAGGSGVTRTGAVIVATGPFS